MDAVLFVGHGSKDPEGNEEVRRFVSTLEPDLAEPIIETCFLEFEKPDIVQGIDACVRRGATRVAIIPIILFSAGHAKIHIPAAMDEAKIKYTDVEFVYGRPVGIHEYVLDILSARVQGTGFGLDDTAVLIVGRGSSDPDANSDLYKISRLYWEKLKAVKWMETAFAGVTFPSIEEGIDRCLKLGASKIIIIPYFLFTGVLIKRMEKMISRFKERYPGHDFVLADYFGFHPKLRDILLDRVKEAVQDKVKMNCDTCQYRVAAMKNAEHHHHHHHHDDHVRGGMQ
ncbi:sirohydrochlorin chelatase [Microaerobacter geothermalis]|uniref:sirohydrochlorin chelatase n=1 Tax=Microaerobacter geothermalis TaxID=674972 RepID=UPI001F358EA1|nr:sirohydrochlorin chelatase [Microaerobacter geothermalis]MCF6095270.1 sirohydrochlorin chelatase [Microaerobacter geothermalis]